MDPDVRELTKAVTLLIYKVDGLIAHFTAIDGDYERVRNTLIDHEKRLQKLEQEHNFEPQSKIGESSALFNIIKSASTPEPTLTAKADSELIKTPKLPTTVLINQKSKLKRFINAIYDFIFVRRFFS